MAGSRRILMDTVEIIDLGGGSLYKASEGSAGFDLKACIPHNIILPAGECMLIPTGVAVYLKNPAYVGIIAPRSGLGHKHGIILGNGIGVIDSDYQGELKVSLWNRSEFDYELNKNDRIAQLLILSLIRVNFKVVDSLIGKILE
jgi:dUTP pyrophosphatase